MSADTQEQEEPKAVGRPRTRKKRKIHDLRNQETARKKDLDDPRSSKGKKRRARHKIPVIQAKIEYLETQNMRRTWNSWLAFNLGTIFKFGFGLVFSTVVAVLAVSGAYDAGLETKIPLRIYGGIVAGLGVAFIVLGGYFYRRTKKARRLTGSSIAAMVAGVVLILLSVGVFYTYSKHAQIYDVTGHPHDVVTNTDAYHYWVSSATVRHLFYRKLPEGLVAGLIGVYASWKYGIRAAKDYKYYYAPLRWFSTPGDTRPAETWKIMVAPFLAIIASVVTWIAGWYAFLWHNHDQAISNWIHHLLPYHVHMVPAATSTSLTDAIVTSALVAWPAFIIGFISARFWGRAPAAGPIHDAVEVNALYRIKTKGRLEGERFHSALAWFQSRGHQGLIVKLWYIGETWVHPDDPDVHGAVAYANHELAKIGKGPRVVYRAAQVSMPFLVIIGFIYVYIIARGK